MSLRIFLVEDDPEMRRATRVLLMGGGYRVSEAASAEEALAEISRELPDIAIIDIDLPGMSGMKLVDILRGESKTVTLPILLLTAMKRGVDKVQGLRRGADDYVTKPYDPEELTARVEALLRRSSLPALPSEVLTLDALKVDVTAREVTLKGTPLLLRRKEFELLTYFLRHKGQLLKRDRIARAVWGEEAIVTDNALSGHLKNLRAKLCDYGDRLETFIGEGYRLR